MSIPETEAAERRLFPKRDAHEKGSAMGLIKADAEATAQKTARLRALRMARETEAPAEAAPAPKSARRTARRGRS